MIDNEIEGFIATLKNAGFASFTGAFGLRTPDAPDERDREYSEHRRRQFLGRVIAALPPNEHPWRIQIKESPTTPYEGDIPYPGFKIVVRVSY